MNASKWINVTVDRNLCKEIDRVIKVKKKEFGTPFYSRADFVRHAITEQLRQLEVAC